MPSEADRINEQIKHCEQILKSHLKETYDLSAPCKITLPARFERIVHKEYAKEEKKPCGCDDTDISEDSVDSRAHLNPGGKRVSDSVDAQIEFLRHELFLTKNQVLERNKQIEKLEGLIQHQYAKQKHNCEGSSTNMIKLVQLMHDAVKLQNSQIENLSNLKTRIFALEGAPSAVCKNMNERALKNKCTCCKSKENLNSRVRFADEQDTKSNTVFAELEKQKNINCQLNENTRRLEEEVGSLRSKLDQLRKENESFQILITSFDSEKHKYEKQISCLTESNKKLSCNISKMDAERDKMVKELDSSDELINEMKIQLQNANVQVKNYESQYNSMSERNGKIQELLSNSERIVECLNKQKMEVSKELGETSARYDDLQKSYESVKHKYHQTLKMLKKVKKDFTRANEEKAVLQSQLQEYVSKVRQIEDMLLQKEQEREFLFEQFKELTARDNCKSVMMETNCLSPVEDNHLSSSEAEPIEKADVVIQTEFPSVVDKNLHEGLDLEEQAKELQRELTLERKTSDKLHEVIRTTRQEAIDATTRNESLTEQLEMMAQNVRHLENQVKTISVSLEKYRKECIYQEAHCQRLERDLVQERFHTAIMESSPSTML